jgi:hypothetical protein
MGGGSLYERLVDRRSPLFDAEGNVRHSFARTVDLAAQAASGIAHLHQQVQLKQYRHEIFVVDNFFMHFRVVSKGFMCFLFCNACV